MEREEVEENPKSFWGGRCPCGKAKYLYKRKDRDNRGLDG